MTRTWKKQVTRHGASSGRRVVPTSQQSPGHRQKHSDGPWCSFCCNPAPGPEMDIGRNYTVPVCDRRECRDAARRLGEEAS